MATVALSAPSRPLVDTRPLVTWLYTVAALVFAMVVVGGITRLTESGLSITEWKPVSGALPPLGEAQWLTEYEKYQRTYQAQSLHAGISLADFKFIFFWEWVHRLLGRVIGLAYALPLAWFWLKGRVPDGYKGRLIVLLALGGLQGFIGWWMVTSGLWAGDRVSHYRLAVHLLLALTILALLVWTALDLRRWPERAARFTPLAAIVGAGLYLQLLFGAWMAGMRAGHVAADWPLMQGRVYPEGVDWSVGVFRAFTADPYLVHFIHRWWAWGAAALLFILARAAKPVERRASIALHAAVGTQILLGIATVMTGIGLWVAVLHQAVGALVVAAYAYGANVIGRHPGELVRTN